MTLTYFRFQLSYFYRFEKHRRCRSQNLIDLTRIVKFKHAQIVRIALNYSQHRSSFSVVFLLRVPLHRER